MKVFIIGITGGVGTHLARLLLDRGDTVSGLVRRDEQRQRLNAVGIDAKIGDLTALSAAELAEVIGDVDAIAFTAGAGGAGADATAAIDRDGVVKAIDAAGINGISRFGLVSAFPEAWRERNLGAGFDHYIAMKKAAEIALANSDLDWISLRPSVLRNEAGQGGISLGPAQIHEDITREDVAATLAALLHEPRIAQQILEVTQGTTPIDEAVAANVR